MYFEQNVAIEHGSRPWNRNFVTRDGHVHPCCLTTQTGDRQAQNRRSLGNLIDLPIEDSHVATGVTLCRGRPPGERAIVMIRLGVPTWATPSIVID